MHQEEKIPSLKHLAHDLNNIFTRILTSVELLKHKNPTDLETASLLNNIEAGTYLASEIIENSFGKYRSNTTRRVNVNSIIQDVIRSFALQQKNRIVFSLNLEPKLKLITAKYSDIYRVVMNLITNSIEAIVERGNISITTNNSAENDQIIIEITDDGCGIEPTLINNIFNEHYSTKSKDKNSGVGLSIVKSIVELHNGNIHVKSESNATTTFTICFPAAVTSARIKSEEQKTILVAEDEDLLRELLCELLQTHGYKVICASTGNEVLDLLKINNPNLLIIDRKMPDLDGIECITELRNKQTNIPIILASGSHTENTELILSLNIGRIVNKPYNFEEMLSIIEELIL